jgi:hypothetical protein
MRRDSPDASFCFQGGAAFISDSRKITLAIHPEQPARLHSIEVGGGHLPMLHARAVLQEG